MYIICAFAFAFVLSGVELEISRLLTVWTGYRGMKYWLMKAEPESRLVKGKDVKVRLDHPLMSLSWIHAKYRHGSRSSA